MNDVTMFNYPEHPYVTRLHREGWGHRVQITRSGVALGPWWVFGSRARAERFARRQMVRMRRIDGLYREGVDRALAEQL